MKGFESVSSWVMLKDPEVLESVLVSAVSGAVWDVWPFSFGGSLLCFQAGERCPAGCPASPRLLCLCFLIEQLEQK